MTNARVGMLGGLALATVTAGAAAADPYFGDAPGAEVAVPAPAPAHHNSWYGFGLVRSTFTATTIGTVGTTAPIVADTIRFGLGVTMTRHLYIGADTDFGTISNRSDAGFPDSGRSSVMQPTATTGTLHGTTGAIRALAGVLARAGGLTGAAELAYGYRISTTDGNSLLNAQAQSDTLVEGRGRLELRVSSILSLGAVAGVDLRDHRDVSFGLTLGLHLSGRDR